MGFTKKSYLTVFDPEFGSTACSQINGVRDFKSSLVDGIQCSLRLDNEILFFLHHSFSFHTDICFP